MLNMGPFWHRAGGGIMDEPVTVVLELGRCPKEISDKGSRVIPLFELNEMALLFWCDNN